MQALLRHYPELRGFPHVDLGVRPTPVETRHIDGLDVLVKRDDRTSDVYGGNKVRSLEFLLARSARRLLTYTALGAHHGYAVAVHAARLGLDTDVIVVRRGNSEWFLDALRDLGGRVVMTDGAVGALLATLRLWRPGTRIVPPGGLSARGALGYVEAAFEIEEPPPSLYVPLGTGTTVSGLLAGLALRGARTEVVAVVVAEPAAAWPPLLRRRARAAIRLLRKHDPSIPDADPATVPIRIVRSEGGYGEATPAARAAVEVARPLRLEPTYTGKALAALLAERPRGAMLLDTYAPPIPASASR